MTELEEAHSEADKQRAKYNGLVSWLKDVMMVYAAMKEDPDLPETTVRVETGHRTNRTVYIEMFHDEFNAVSGHIDNFAWESVSTSTSNRSREYRTKVTAEYDW